MNWIKRTLLILLPLFLVIGWIVSRGTFRLREIVVLTPLKHLSEIDLVRMSGVKKGQNLFWLSLEKVSLQIQPHPWIESVAVAKSYPGRLVVEVTEQQPVALVKWDQLYLVNHHGKVFKKMGAKDPKNFPIITGLGRKEESKVRDSVKLLHHFQGSETLRRSGLSEIHWEPKQGVSIFTVRPVVRAVLGKEKWEERLDRLSQILPEMKPQGRQSLSIDLTYEKRIFVKGRT